jgi:hypothetical protein
MSYVTEIFTQPAIREAADALDLLQSCQSHKLPADSGKHRALADIMKGAATRFKDLAEKQTVLGVDEFYRRALERVSVIRHERAVLAKARAEKRRRDTAEREEMQRELAGLAA